ncbi:MAG TPA: hypothetical protein VK598_05890 [Nitrospiraceae bacterium]|nr:hypothetical protein [Nitrospiraceae bacterium]
MHDFRVWANYLNIDDLLRLWGSGYKSFIDQNLSLLLFFVGGIAELCYIACAGQARYLHQLQQMYDLTTKNLLISSSEFKNTPLYQRHMIYKNLGFIRRVIDPQSVNPNLLSFDPSLPSDYLNG